MNKDQMEYRVLLASSAHDNEQWNALVTRSPMPDTYYRPGYVSAYADGNATAIAVVLQTRSNRFLVPLLLRRLSSLPFASDASDYDAVTPYGYGGILALDSKGVSIEDAIEFIDVFKRWCLSERVVSCMLRLHPLMGQGDRFSAASQNDNGVTVREYGLTKAIDLASWDENLEAPLGMSKGRHSDLKFARRNLSVTITSCDAPEGLAEVRTFREIYNETMRRIGASPSYLFSEDYYLVLMQGVGKQMAVAVTRAGEDAVGGALFFADDRFAHYHLSGTTVDGRRLKANTLALVSGADWARRHGCSLLHLGGGVTPNDSLLQFKSSIGTRTFSYSFMTIIVNQVRYDELVELRTSHEKSACMRRGFFPEYRA